MNNHPGGEFCRLLSASSRGTPAEKGGDHLAANRTGEPIERLEY